MPQAYGPYLAKVLDWHDGDTAHVDVDLGFSQRAAAYTLAGKPQLSCRIYGINAPEMSTEAGKAALAYAEQLCPPGTMVTVVSRSWDKYGARWDGTITLPDGTDFAGLMLAAGHAVPMTGLGGTDAPAGEGGTGAARVGTGPGLAGAGSGRARGRRRRQDDHPRAARVRGTVRRRRQQGAATQAGELMTEGLASGPPEEDKPDEPIGWQVLDPDGNVVASGGQTVTEASADAGEEQ